MTAKWLLITIIFTTFNFFTINAQDYFQQANDAFESKDFKNSLINYKKAFLENKNDREKQIQTTFKIAESYRFLDLTIDAEIWYKRAIMLEYPDPIVHYYYAEMQRKNSKFDDAINEYEKYSDLTGDKQKTKNEIEQCIAEANTLKKNKEQENNANVAQNTSSKSDKAKISENNKYQKFDVKEQKQITKYDEEVQIVWQIDSSLNKINEIKKTGTKNELIKAYTDVAKLQYSSGNYSGAIESFTNSLKANEEINDKSGASTALLNIGVANYSGYRYDDAISSFKKSLEIKEELKDNEGVSKLLYRIGSVYFDKKDYSKAKEYFEQILESEEKTNNPEKIAASSNNLAIMLYEMKDFEKSIEYLEKSIDISTKSSNQKEISISLNNIGNIKFEMQNYDEAIEYYEKSLNIKEKIDYKKGLAITFHNIGNAYSKINKNDLALEYYNKCEKLTTENSFFDIMYNNYVALSDAYTTKGNCQLAFENYKLADQYRQFAVNIGQHKQISEFQNKFDKDLNPDEISLLTEELTRQRLLMKELNEKREMELELKNLELSNKESEIAMQKTQKYASFAGLILLVAIAFLLFRGYKEKKKQNEIINQKNKELEQQKEEIIVQRDLVTEQKDHIELIHHELTDSIHYAERIQTAVLPSMDKIFSSLQDCKIQSSNFFILFKPRDIVSGDFFYFEKKKDILLFAVSDCTGHGVPGAFMSMLGISFLNEIVSKEHIETPAEVLNHLREYIIKSLRQKGRSGEQKDGMDINFIAYNSVSKELQFAGANNPLWIVSEPEIEIQIENDNKQERISIIDGVNAKLTEIKADKMPVAIYEKMDSFTNHKVQLTEGMKIYLSTDGFSDQFGGPSGKKFMSKNLKKIILDNNKTPFDKQKNILDNIIEEWKAFNNNIVEQTDDITIMGFKI